MKTNAQLITEGKASTDGVPHNALSSDLAFALEAKDSTHVKAKADMASIKSVLASPMPDELVLAMVDDNLTVPEAAQAGWAHCLQSIEGAIDEIVLDMDK